MTTRYKDDTVTEWEEILAQKGIIPKREDINAAVDEYEAELEAEREAAALIHPLENATLEELDEYEDDFDDEKLLEQYRQQRLNELKAQSIAEKYGSVTEISRDEYTREVTEKSKECWVVVSLWADNRESKAMDVHVRDVASKFRAVKFVRIRGSLCIANFPDKDCPTLIVYNNGECVKQLIGMTHFGSLANLKPEVIEWVLAELGAVTTDLEEDPRFEGDGKSASKGFVRLGTESLS